MPDVPGNTTTSATITVGATMDGQLELAGDRDWYALQLTAGQEVAITLTGLSLVDPYLRIRDSVGNVLFENDDIRPDLILNSRVIFTAASTGTYYVDVGAANESATGSYKVSVKPYTPLPVWEIGQIAEFLAVGSHQGSGGSPYHFNATQGGTITVNVTALNTAGQHLARQALAMWSDVIGITFVEVTSGGQITFDDNQAGAFANVYSSNGITTTAHVNIHAERLVTYGSTIGSYSFQNYIHEIGHALGLGHAGFYGGGPTDPYTDALYANDARSTTAMSYFPQDVSTYFSNLGFSYAFLGSPMIADVAAMQLLYGLSTTTRTGDTTYGFNSNAGRDVFNASLHPGTAYTIFDSGGIDTLDYSGFNATQVIHLTQGAYSSVGGLTGTVVIALGTIIENAIGGSGADTIIGNSTNNILTGNLGSDNLTGGAGADAFRDTVAGLNGDTIVDFSIGDRIVITNANLVGFSFSLSGTTLTFTGGSLTLASAPTGTIVASAAEGGGVQLTVSDAQNDFNGDGRSDVLWRHEDGTTTNWLGQANGGFGMNGGNAWHPVPVSWKIAGTGDFNGDGRDDILWRHDDGTFTNWLSQPNGGFVANGANAWYAVPVSWSIVGTGDFNGDGRDDVLWRNDHGQLGQWLGTASGGFTDNGANAFYGVPTIWTVAAVGDFNGDGRSDILWRNDTGRVTQWLGTATGAFKENSGHLWAQVDNAWQVAGTGDFNGDGRTDVLWRNASGDLTNWLAQPTGGFVANDANSRSLVDTSWNIAAIGDANGDGRDDVIWRHDTGTVTNWLGQPNGGFAVNDANAWNNVPTNWHVQPDNMWG